MGDEIMQLQNNILAISQQIDALDADTRYGLIAYRDRGDAYVTRRYDFTSSVVEFQTSLTSIAADGGGDNPESLNAALHMAVNEVAWRGDDTVRLIFLVADAPPHLDYPNDDDYAVDMRRAAEMGIRIHPIASSGLTPDGEFIFRQIAQVTLGRFLFLTYENATAVAPGDVRPDLSVGEPVAPGSQQGDYTVERLDELVTGLIRDELAAVRVDSSLCLTGQAPSVGSIAFNDLADPLRRVRIVLLGLGLIVFATRLLPREVEKRKRG
jgi:hypothetical protein